MAAAGRVAGDRAQSSAGIATISLVRGTSASPYWLGGRRPRVAPAYGDEFCTQSTLFGRPAPGPGQRSWRRRAVGPGPCHDHQRTGQPVVDAPPTARARCAVFGLALSPARSTGPRTPGRGRAKPPIEIGSLALVIRRDLQQLRARPTIGRNPRQPPAINGKASVTGNFLLHGREQRLAKGHVPAPKRPLWTIRESGAVRIRATVVHRLARFALRCEWPRSELRS